MAQLPPEFAEALGQNERARAAFEALPPTRQAEWVRWVERGRTRGGRNRRLGEAVSRLAGWTPTAAVAADETVEEVPERPPPPPPREWWPWLLMLLLLILGGLAALYFLTRDGEERTVPRVVGLQERAAIDRLAQRGLVARVTPRPSDRPRGEVFGQDPRAGTEVEKGDRVQIAVSSAPARVAVPDVTGESADDASRTLVAAGLVPDERSVFSAEEPGVVVAQDPESGERVQRSATVRINVSRGRGQTTVPSVIGDDQEEAIAKLRRAELTPRVAQVPSAEPAGTVIAQDPQAAERVAKGARVRINVSTGGGGGGTATTTETTAATTTVSTTTTTATTTAGPTSVPDLAGQDQTGATRQLIAAGLRPRVVYVRSDQPDNTVVAQSPAAGSSVARGSRVRINVSAGPTPAYAAVPDVLGESETAARATLRDAGFTVAVFRVAGRRGIVVDQQPAEGENAPEGGQVSIFVGRG